MSLKSATRVTASPSPNTAQQINGIAAVVVTALAGQLDKNTRNALADLVLTCTEGIQGFVSSTTTLKAGDTTVNLTILQEGRLSLTVQGEGSPITLGVDATTFNNCIGDF